IAIIAAGGPSLLSASEIEPGFFSSLKIPVPPTTVNQNVATTGAMTATVVTSSRIVRPREIRLTNIAIIVPYPMNKANKNTVHHPSLAESQRYVLILIHFYTLYSHRSKYITNTI